MDWRLARCHRGLGRGTLAAFIFLEGLAVLFALAFACWGEKGFAVYLLTLLQILGGAAVSAAMVAALFISTYALVGGRSPKLLGGGTVRRWVGLVLMAVSGGAMVCLVMMLYAALSRD